MLLKGVPPQVKKVAIVLRVLVVGVAGRLPEVDWRRHPERRIKSSRAQVRVLDRDEMALQVGR